MVARPGSFAVLLPVKSPGTGKSRLSALSDDDRTRLAAAFARDAVRACLDADEVARVLVISDDAAFAASLVTDRVAACDDPGTGLNGALRHGATVLRDTHPALQPVALCADLPSLTGADLSAALTDVSTSATPCFVADADATGTTLYSAAYDDFDPRFGRGSAAAHRASGARSLPGTLTTLRRDVDDLAGLRVAIDLGVGPATAAALAVMPPAFPKVS